MLSTYIDALPRDGGSTVWGFCVEILLGTYYANWWKKRTVCIKFTSILYNACYYPIAGCTLHTSKIKRFVNFAFVASLEPMFKPTFRSVFRFAFDTSLVQHSSQPFPLYLIISLNFNSTSLNISLSWESKWKLTRLDSKRVY